MSLSLTLTESAKLTEDTLQKGVIESMAMESPILSVLPFMDIVGSGYTYNQETALAEVQFRAVGEDYTPAPLTFKQQTEALSILGDEATVDTFQQQVYSKPNDLMVTEVLLKAKAIAHKYELQFIKGDIATEVNGFNGLTKRVIADQTFTAGANYAEDVDKLLDMVQGGAEYLVMSKATRRKLVAEVRQYIRYKEDQFGNELTMYGSTPILLVPDEYMDEGEIFAVAFGAKEALCGLQNGGIKITPLGQMDSSPQLKTRLEWFCGMALFNDRKVAYRKKA